MMQTVRKLFPYSVFFGSLLALAWAISFGNLPPADFTFVNGTEIQSVDPARVTGAPEGRIIRAIFEGLYRSLPRKGQPNELEPQPAVAESCTISDDLKTYTFQIRPTARWSDGTALTAHDFVWSWRRFLHPETASEYSFQLHYVVNADKYTAAAVEPGDRVEIELTDRNKPAQTFPRGTILAGKLVKVQKPPRPEATPAGNRKEKQKLLADWRQRWIYTVEVKPMLDGEVDWKSSGNVRDFCKISSPHLTPMTEQCLHVLPHFESQVGIRAIDDHTLVVQLKNPTPYFLDLVAFYPLYPVNRKCVETHGTPAWTKPHNIVSNGPFVMKFRRIRDRIRLQRNSEYWNAASVQIQVIDALAVNSDTTQLNLYENNQVDWITSVPNSIIPELEDRNDLLKSPMLTTYFYRVNVSRPPFDDVRVRQALNATINKREIVNSVTRAGQIPARSFVPPGLPGYEPGLSGAFNVKAARQLLADAGYPEARGFPKIQILYNTSEGHRDIAEVVQRQWKNHLGIEVELKNLEWGVYLDAVRTGQYDIARAGWIGDYPDPNTFLDMFVTDRSTNQTGWSDSTYDELIASAAAESDPTARLDILRQAEQILMDQQPIMPIYFYVSLNMVRPYVKNFYANIQDVHPLLILQINPAHMHNNLSKRGLQ